MKGPYTEIESLVVVIHTIKKVIPVGQKLIQLASYTLFCSRGYRNYLFNLVFTLYYRLISELTKRIFIIVTPGFLYP